MSDPPIRDAATLILLDGHNVLMGRRHADHRFMPGKFVFPGGALDPVDRRMPVARPLPPAIAAALLARTRRAPSFAVALALAALRETFEETGLALGEPVPAPKAPPGVWAQYAACGVQPSLERLEFLARAITPPGRPKRFDARFFVADAALIAHRVEGVIHAKAELTELVWTPLDAALALDIPNITRQILGDLAALGPRPWNPERPRPFYRSVRGQHVRDIV